MKILIILLFPITIFAQPKGTNTIIVHGTTIESVVKNLHAMKFSVANDGFGTVTTIPKFMENHGHLQITVVINDSTAYITGIFENKEITPELFKNKESYGGHDLEGSFKVLDNLAHLLGNRVEYAKLNN